MPSVPRWLSLVLLPVAALCDAGAYYAARAVLVVHVREAQSLEDYGLVLTAVSVAGLAGTVLAGLVAIGTGPWAMAAAGGAVCAAGALMLGVLPPDAAALGAVFLGFGYGLARVAIFGAAARAFPDFRTEHLRNATCFGIYGATNLVAMGVSEAAGRVAEDLGTRPVFFAAFVGAGTLFLVAIGLGVAVFATRDAKDALTEPPKRTGDAHVYAVVGTLVLGGFVWTFWSSGFDLLFELVQAGGDGYAGHQALLQVNPMLVTVGCALGFAVSLGLHFGKVRAPTLVVMGLGLVLISAGMVALLGADRADDAIVWPGVLLLSIGEAFAAPLVYSRLAGDLPRRLPTLALAGFWVLTQAPGLILRTLELDEGLTRSFAVLGAVSAAFVGIGAAILGVLWRRALHPDAEEPTEF